MAILAHRDVLPKVHREKLKLQFSSERINTLSRVDVEGEFDLGVADGI